MMVVFNFPQEYGLNSGLSFHLSESITLAAIATETHSLSDKPA
jgi:hypothetical protein